MSRTVLLATLAVLTLTSRDALAQSTTRMSVDQAGNQANSYSQFITLSRDGKSAVFTSGATNLVPGDTNGKVDVFAKDIATGAIIRLSVGPGGAQANGDSYGPLSISADGRFVVFASSATNFGPVDTNGTEDIYARDMSNGTMILVSSSTGGTIANGGSDWPAISADGRYVSFHSVATNLVPGDTNGRDDVFVKDLQTGALSRVSVSSGGTEGNGNSLLSSISGDGRYVVFESSSSNLVPGDTNGATDVFLRDTVQGTTSRISIGSGGAQGDNHSLLSSNASISDDGHWVVFDTLATNFDARDTNGASDVYLRDVFAGLTYWESIGLYGVPDGYSGRGVISGDGLVVAWESAATNFVPGDTNGQWDIIVRGANGYERASVSSAGAQSDGQSSSPSLSADGRYVAFESVADNLVPGDTNGTFDVFVRKRFDLPEFCNHRESLDAAGGEGNGASSAGYVSGDGKWVGFESGASNLIPGDVNGVSDVFLKNLADHSIALCSIGLGGTWGDGPSHAPSVSNDGRWVAFASSATNLVAGDTNGVDDVFVFDRATSAVVRVSIDSSGNQANGGSYTPPWGAPSISPDGRYVAFTSWASNLVPGDTNNVNDVFVHDRDLDGNGVFDEQVPGRIRTVRVSVSSAGVQGNAPSGIYGLWISAYGRKVAFHSMASNLVAGDFNLNDVFVRDLTNNTTTLVSVDSAGAQQPGDHYLPSISADLTLANDGRYVSFASTSSTLVPNDTNNTTDVFVRDLIAHHTERVSVSTNGVEAATASERSMVEASGRYVVFDSTAGNLDPSDTDNGWDVYLRDRQASTTEVLSRPANVGDSRQPTVSVGAAVVAFDDTGALVANDTNDLQDVYVHTCQEIDPMVAFCFPGVDGTRTCPCGNPPSGPDRGCMHFGAGPAESSKFSATGAPSLSDDSLVFTAEKENNNAASVLLQSDTSFFGGTTFGAGVRCVHGALKRLYTGTAVFGVFSRPRAFELSVSARTAAVGAPISAGEHRYYFVYYRDPVAAGPCGVPTSTFNCTPAGDVVWTP